MVILKDLAYKSSYSEFKVNINKIVEYIDGNQAVDMTFSFCYGNSFPEIKANIYLTKSDLLNVTEKMKKLSTTAIDYCNPYDPEFCIISIPNTTQNNDNELMFDLIIIIDAGLKNSTFATFTGPAILLTVKQEDLIAFSNEIERQTSECSLIEKLP